MTLRAKDLMIGDWVHIKSSTYGELNSQVFTIEGDDDWKGVWVKDKKCFGRINESEIKPIPLTPEILEKNFEKKALWGIYDDYYDFTIREWNGMFIVNYHYCEIPMQDTQIVGISYVHELQHALRLCGIEKEIII